MGTLGTTLKNAAVDAATAVVGYLGLQASNGTEVTGGSPAYARQAVTYNAASNGVATISGTETFNIPAGGEVGKVALYAAVSGGTALGTDDVTVETYAGQGTYTVTAATITISDPA